ncbi:MAG TPA: hypothetical protein VFR37_11850 [Longimicrobium sp.]|nr:hypothetical protein [Longimicrobium sp.]
MRVITEEALLERWHELEAQRSDHKRRIRMINAELRFLENMSRALVDIPKPLATAATQQAEPQQPVQQHATSTQPASDPAQEKEQAPTPVQIKMPASAGSPVSRVQIPVFRLVQAEPGVEKLDVMQRVAAQVGTSKDSVRETIRRMVRAKKLRQEGERLYLPGVKSANDYVSLLPGEDEKEAAGG